MKKRLTVPEYVEGIRSSNRVILAKAITLMESRLASDQELAAIVLNEVLPYTGKSVRIGITGVPGVGKSTFIDAFGTHLCDDQKKKVAVLAIDPSSARTGGSILGDKTRMYRLSANDSAFIRPSASGTSLGGVASRTRESILLCEAAGFEVILVETVGVGQSETMVRGMVDFFLLLMLAGAGDELQGIKRGIMELCDALIINKVDGDNVMPAKRAAAEYKNALHLFPPSESGWIPRVGLCSALQSNGIDEVYHLVEQYERHTGLNGYKEKQRKAQNLRWLDELVHEIILRKYMKMEGFQHRMEQVKIMVANGEKSVRSALDLLFSA